MSLVCLANCIFVSTLCTMLWFCWQINDDDDDDDDDESTKVYCKHTCPMSHQKTTVTQQKRTQNAIM